MDFTADWQYLLSSSWRIFFICMTCACHIIWIYQKYLPRRRSLLPMFLCFVVRVLVLYIGIQIILGYFCGNSSWYLTVFNSVSMLFAIIIYTFLYYTFEGDLLKILVCGCLSELTASFPFNLSLAIVNYLNGTDNLLYMHGEFHLWDCLLPVLLFPITCLIGILVFPYIKKFRSWNIKHKKLMWSIMLFYNILALSTWLYSNKTVLWGCVLVLSVYPVCTAAVIKILKNRHQKIQTQQSYCHTRQRLVESYLSDLLRQTEQMDNCRKIINAQMEEITCLENCPPNSRKIHSYLSELQQAYEQIRTGIYCDNWLIDSALCYEQKLMEAENISFSCHLQNYRNHLLPDEDMVPLLLLFLDWGIEAVRKLPSETKRFIRLQIYSVKNQVFLRLETSGTKKRRLHKRTFQQYLKKYSGSIRQETMDGYEQATLTLLADSAVSGNLLCSKKI